MSSNKYLIKDLLECVVDNRGKTPPCSESGHPLIEINSMSNDRRFVDYKLVKKYVTDDVYNTCFRSGHPKIGDILIPTVGTLGIISIVDRDDTCIAQNIIALRTNGKICDSRYLYYLLKDEKTKQAVLNLDIGAVQPSIKVPHLMNLEVEIPSLEEQKRIVSVLETIDLKIENNKKIIDALSESIKNLIKVKIPYDYCDNVDGWRIYNLCEIADFYPGYSYKSAELIENSNCAMATIKNFDRHGGFKLDGFKELVPSSKLKDHHLIDLFDIMVAHTDLTQNAEVIGNSEILLSKMSYSKIVMSMDLVKVKTKGVINNFLLAAILNDSRFKNHCLGYVNGTTVLHMSKKALPDYQLLLPVNLNELEPLAAVVENEYKQISNRLEENIKLMGLIKIILPRLISGDIS